MSTFTGVLGSPLVDGVALGCGAVLLHAVLRREVRVRPLAWWSRELTIGSLFAPAIASMVAFGVAFLVFGMNRWTVHGPELAEIATTAVVLIGTAFAVWALWRGGGAPAHEPAPDKPVSERGPDTALDRAA